MFYFFYKLFEIDCIEDLCGYDCKKTCDCQSAIIQDKITGHCSGGCKEGSIGPHCDKCKWILPPLKCQVEF